MKVLITGSSGHLGEALVRTLRRIMHEVVGRDRTASPYTDIVGALEQRETVRAAMAGVHETADEILITRAIELAQGNQAKTARWLGISRMTLQDKLLQYGRHPKGE